MTPSQRAVIQGDSLSLFCVATPLVPVIWSKINGSITGESEVDKGKLIIKNASVEHAGKYRCQAFNAAGSDEDFAIVTVVGEIPFWFSVLGILLHVMVFQIKYSPVFFLGFFGADRFHLFRCSQR